MLITHLVMDGRPYKLLKRAGLCVLRPTDHAPQTGFIFWREGGLIGVNKGNGGGGYSGYGRERETKKNLEEDDGDI